MKKIFFNPLRSILIVVAITLSQGCIQAQSATTEISDPSWSTTTFSATAADTSNTQYKLLAFTLVLSNVSEAESFIIELTDEKEKSAMLVGNYVVKKHENDFYYVEEMNSHDLKTVFGNEINFAVAVSEGKLYKVKSVEMRVKYKDANRSAMRTENTVKVQIPKFKRR